MHHPEANVRHVEVVLRQVGDHRVGVLITNVARARLRELTLGDLHEGVGTIDPEDFPVGADLSTEREGGFAKTAGYVEHLVALLDIEGEVRDVAVNLPVAGEQVTKANPFGGQNFVPALDVSKVVCGDFRHAAAPFPVKPHSGPAM